MSKNFQMIFLGLVIFMTTLILTGCGVKKDLSTRDFIIIIAKGSTQEVKDAVKRVEDINAIVDMKMTFNGQTRRFPLTPAMAAAIYAKDPEIIYILAQNGANMNPKFNDREYGEMKESLYYIAAVPRGGIYINPKIGLALLENGAKDSNYDYTQVLDDAIEIDSPETVEYVLKNKKVKDAVKNRSCDAALFWSTAYNRINGAKEKVQILLDNGFDPNMRCKNGMNAIEWIDKFPKDVNQEAYSLIKQNTK